MPGFFLVATLACAPPASDVRFPPNRTDTGEAEESDVMDRPDDTDTDTDTDTGEPIDPDPTDDVACYPGPARDWQVCLPVVTVDPLPEDYDYPDPLDGSAQYRPPIAWLDLAAEDPSQSLAPNFVLDELAQEWKGRWAVVQPHAVQRLQDLRDDLGALAVNSGYRSPAYNAGVGGATWSRHMYGDAFDLDPVSVSLDTLADACAAHGAGYVGVYESHIHCDWRADTVDEVFYGLGWRSAPAPIVEHEARLVESAGIWTAPAVGWDEGEPLREWVALDGADLVIARSTGRSFAPPSGTATVRVVIGRAVALESALDAY